VWGRLTPAHEANGFHHQGFSEPLSKLSKPSASGRYYNYQENTSRPTTWFKSTSTPVPSVDCRPLLLSKTQSNIGSWRAGAPALWQAPAPSGSEQEVQVHKLSRHQNTFIANPPVMPGPEPALPTRSSQRAGSRGCPSFAACAPTSAASAAGTSALRVAPCQLGEACEAAAAGAHQRHGLHRGPRSACSCARANGLRKSAALVSFGGSSAAGSRCDQGFKQHVPT
jgi:hypothetical protein